MSDRFVIPGFRSTPEERRAAVAQLNTISLTVEQWEEGWAVYEATQLRVMKEGLTREAPMAALEDYCAGAGLFPADLAAAAIYVRADEIIDAKFSGVDLKTEHPETYVRCILEPITENDLEFPNRGDLEELALED